MAELNPDLVSVVQTVRDHYAGFVEVVDDSPVRVLVDPNAEACPMYLIDLGAEFVFGVGRGGCRWELEFKPDDLGLLWEVWDAVVAGHVSEVFGPARSRVQVTLSDGTTRVVDLVA